MRRADWTNRKVDCAPSAVRGFVFAATNMRLRYFRHHPTNVTRLCCAHRNFSPASLIPRCETQLDLFINCNSSFLQTGALCYATFVCICIRHPRGWCKRLVKTLAPLQSDRPLFTLGATTRRHRPCRPMHAPRQHKRLPVQALIQPLYSTTNSTQFHCLAIQHDKLVHLSPYTHARHNSATAANHIAHTPPRNPSTPPRESCDQSPSRTRCVPRHPQPAIDTSPQAMVLARASGMPANRRIPVCRRRRPSFHLRQRAFLAGVCP